MLDLEQGALPVQAARVAGELARAADHPVAGDHDAQRVAAHRRADVPRIRPGPQGAREIAVGGRLSVGHAGDQFPDPAVEFGALDPQGQLEHPPVPAEVLAELTRDVLPSLIDARTEPRPVGPGPVPRKVQSGQGPFLPDDRHLSQARREHRVLGTLGPVRSCRHCLLPSVAGLPLSRRAGQAGRETAGRNRPGETGRAGMITPPGRGS
jgi:hypothetical protein